MSRQDARDSNNPNSYQSNPATAGKKKLKTKYTTPNTSNGAVTEYNSANSNLWSNPGKMMGKKGYIVLNKPYAQQIRGTHHLTDSRKIRKRGYIVHHPIMMKTLGYVGRVNFLFNPESISVTHQAFQDLYAIGDPSGLSDWESGGGSSALISSGIGSTSIRLLFDRTYEVNGMYGGNPSKDSAAYLQKVGVYADVLSMYQYLGIVKQDYGVDPSNTFTTTATMRLLKNGLDERFYPSRIAAPTFSYLVLGPIRLYGAITGMNVTYTHWSSELVPMRCVIDLSVVLYNSTSFTPVDNSLLDGINAFRPTGYTTAAQQTAHNDSRSATSAEHDLLNSQKP